MGRRIIGTRTYTARSDLEAIRIVEENLDVSAPTASGFSLTRREGDLYRWFKTDTGQRQSVLEVRGGADSTVVSHAAQPTASRSRFVLHVVHVVGRGPSPFLAHVGAVAHLTFVRPCWGNGGCSA